MCTLNVQKEGRERIDKPGRRSVEAAVRKGELDFTEVKEGKKWEPKERPIRKFLEDFKLTH